MHSSTIAGSMPARRTASRDDQRAELGRGEVLQRAEELAGRRADGADDDRLHACRLAIGSMSTSCTVVASPSERLQPRAGSTARRAASTSRAHCGARGVDEQRRVPSRRDRRDARSSAGPTAARHANVDLAGRERRAAQQLGQRAGTACSGAWSIDLTDDRSSHRIAICMIDPIIRAMRLVLASASPRRAELLRAAGFDVRRASPSTSTSASRAGRAAGATTSGGWRRRSRRAALGELADAGRDDRRRSSAPTRPSSSTATILGKPRDDARRARAMLRRLSGRRHEVLTGRQPAVAASARSGRSRRRRVWFAPLTRRGHRLVRRERGGARQGRGATPFRAWRRGSSRESTARTRTSSGCRSPPCTSCSASV